ncbi:hypothetical protein OG369_38850 [Streptomyces sp. NBC_01221]|uniref:hypothetical protein n=1 Tax=Streptomyces sp. NBC_01221 TaxID=2903782 RepID=UPI00225B5C79|nr:hypothetical protein [Streptomyces sp. NBC_01221]MCX4791822.1 hypothetical protein [Streptomyces sp. NBC_01221]
MRRQTQHMFHETPIYHRLVAERGDIPAHVRGEAQRLERDLERVITPAPHPDPASHHAAASRSRT